MRRINRAYPKFGAFVVVMTILTAGLFLIFGDYRSGSVNNYTAVFTDASDVKSGDSVRVAGVRVGTVTSVDLQQDNTVLVAFDADRSTVLTSGTKVAARYLNLVGDRYLALIDTPGATNAISAGSRIDVDRTVPALDLDQLLGGLKPVIQGLKPDEINALSASLIEILQGQGSTVESLFSRTSSFTNTLADNGQIVQDLIDHLNTAMATLARDGNQFSATLERMHHLVSELSTEREPIGEAIEALSNGTASLTSFLGQARPPLAETIDQLNRLAPNLDAQLDRIDTALARAPENYRKLARIGSYGTFINYYLCGLSFRVSDLEGRTAEFPWTKQTEGRCAEPQ
ncbi:MCE family protein [Mycobacterium sp. 236(2023)]|uniref:MCE family protein n=1 Tax=Mycobacterium sp. 236(2023) TaxID=3038163 RepID=UPI0024157F3F|nr:MCE family protein [Mycobacterium sp. 236(2023)]MDG4668178.1 MCE family protein [Mycobacterium sp. 236(2023)]